MKTVKIPVGTSPLWECEINGMRFSYPAGTTQSVPDQVAALINTVEKMLPQKAKPVQDGLFRHRVKVGAAHNRNTQEGYIEMELISSSATPYSRSTLPAGYFPVVYAVGTYGQSIYWDDDPNGSGLPIYAGKSAPTAFTAMAVGDYQNMVNLFKWEEPFYTAQTEIPESEGACWYFMSDTVSEV